MALAGSINSPEASTKMVNGSSPTDSSSTSTAPAKNLLSLPSELADIIVSSLSNHDALNMRSTCRDLLHKTAYNFCQRHFDGVQIDGTAKSVIDLTSMLQSTNLPAVQSMAESLVVRSSLVTENKDFLKLQPWVSESSIGFEGHALELQSGVISRILPTAEEVTQLFAAMPELERVYLAGWVEWWAGVNVLPAFLKGIAGLPSQTSQLRQLMISSAHMNGALLAEALETHKHNLTRLRIWDATLTSGSTWREILQVMSSMNLENISVINMRDPRLYHDPTVIMYEDLYRFPQSIQTLHAQDEEGWKQILMSAFDLEGKQVKPGLKLILDNWVASTVML